MALSILDDDVHYNEALAAFHRHGTQREVSMNWWKTKMPDIIAKTSSTEPFRVLAVGAGNGKPYDEELLNMLCTSQKHIVYTVVEPLKTAVKEFQALARKYSLIEFRWFCTTWQDFQDKEWKKEDGSQYNLIHFVHSIYYIYSNELEVRLQGCYAEMLNAGGALVIFAAEKQQNIFFWLEYFDKQYNWNFSMELVVKIAQKGKWEFADEELNSDIDLSKCFEEQSTEGNLIFDFLTQTKHFRETASREKIQAAMEHLEKITDDGGDGTKTAYGCPFHIATIWKST